MRTMKNTLKEFTHRVSICSVRDVVESADTVSIIKEVAKTRWAKIETKKPPSKFNVFNMAEDNNTNLPTHKIVLFYDRTIDISVDAWVHEKRAQSGDRWYRIVSTKELDDDSRYLVLECVLKQRGVVTQPVQKNVGPELHIAAPTGFQL